MGVMDLVALGCRITQFIFAIISLGLLGYSESYNSIPSLYSPKKVPIYTAVPFTKHLSILLPPRLPTPTGNLS